MTTERAEKQLEVCHLVQGPLLPDWLALQRRHFDASGRSGAVLSFEGVIRADTIRESSVEAIEYSAYEPLAERLLDQMEHRILHEYRLHALRIWHALGRVEAGQCSMLVLLSAAHRAEALDGLRAAVEAVKAGAPVWKREILRDGNWHWVEGRPFDLQGEEKK